MSLAVWAIDPDRRRQGQVKATACTAVFRDADVGTWQIDIPLKRRHASLFQPGWRVLINDGAVTMSGPITDIAPNLADWTLTLSGVDDLVHARDRLVYPNPAQAADSQGDAYFKRTGPAAEVIDYLVHKNAGSGALADRRVPGLAMAVGQGGLLGSTVTANLRFKNLLEESRALARLGGVTFWAVQEGELIRFRFRVPEDRSRWVRFTGRNTGVTEGSYNLGAPTGTAAIVAGQGEGAARTIIERTRTSEWGRRIEIFKDQRDTDDDAELEQSATEQLDDGAASAGAQFTVVETPRHRFGTDFFLGDTVSVEVGTLTISEPVRAVELAWDGQGRTAKLTLGDNDAADQDTPTDVKRWKELDARVRSQEVR